MQRRVEMAVAESGRIRKLMTLARKETAVKDIFADWPDSYYREESLAKRRDYIEEQLIRHPDSKEDQRRKELLDRRLLLKGKEEADLFIRAWMMIRIMENDRISFLNRKSKEKELRENLRQLCILDYEESDELIREWRDFARKYLIICCESSSYKTVGFGLIHINSEKAAFKIAAEIDLVTRTVPSRFSLENECLPFRNTVIQIYCELLENGQEYWERYCR